MDMNRKIATPVQKMDANIELSIDETKNMPLVPLAEEDELLQEKTIPEGPHADSTHLHTDDHIISKLSAAMSDASFQSVAPTSSPKANEPGKVVNAKNKRKRISGSQIRKRRRIERERRELENKSGVVDFREMGNQTGNEHSSYMEVNETGDDIMSDTRESPICSNRVGMSIPVDAQNDNTTDHDNHKEGDHPMDNPTKPKSTTQKKKRNRKNHKLVRDGRHEPLEGTEVSNTGNSNRDGPPNPIKATDKTNTGTFVEPSRMTEKRSDKEKQKKPTKKPEDRYQALVKEDELRLVIVQRDKPQDELPKEVQENLEIKILSELDKVLDTTEGAGRPPIMVGSGFVRGALRVECLDKFTADWLKTTVAEPDFYPGHTLTAVTVSSLRKKPELVKVTTWVPGTPVDFADLTKRIGILNPSLKTEFWVQFKTELKQNGQLVTFGIPKERLNELEALECTAFCGMKTLEFRIKRDSHKNQQK